MRIEERLARGGDDDIVIMGEIIERGLNTDFGRLVLAMLNNFKSMEIQKSIANKESSDKILGRLEGYENLMSDLRGMILEKQRLQTPLDPVEPETELAVEQMTPVRGGEI